MASLPCPASMILAALEFKSAMISLRLVPVTVSTLYPPRIYSPSKVARLPVTVGRELPPPRRRQPEPALKASSSGATGVCVVASDVLPSCAARCGSQPQKPPPCRLVMGQIYPIKVKIGLTGRQLPARRGARKGGGKTGGKEGLRPPLENIPHELIP